MLQNLRPLFASLHAHRVEYLVIGGVAAIAYGVPRLTLDLDIVIRPTLSNAAAMLDAFTDAGLGTAALTSAQDVVAHEITIFQDRIRVDVQTRTPGIEFESAFGRRNTVQVEGVPVHLVGLDDLVASKRAAGRPQDLEDIRILRPST